MNITHLQTTRYNLFKNLCQSAYDQIYDENDYNCAIDALKYLNNGIPGILTLFKEGFTFCMLPEFAERIEELTEAKMPFIVVVTDELPNGDEYIFAVVNGEDVEF